VNASTTEYTHAIGDLIVAHEITGKLYRNVAAVTIAASDTTEDIEIEAVEVGTTSNASVGAVTVIVGPAMDGVTISNPESVLGSDDETKVALIDRSRAKMSALSPLGPKDAYNYVAQTPEYAETGTAITRSTTFADPDTGEVSVYLATATGAPDAPDVAIVQAAFDEWAEPWCTTSTAVAATEVTVAVTYEIWLRSSLTEAQIRLAISNALSVYFAATRIGGVLIPPATEGKIYVGGLEVVIAASTTDAGTAIGTVRVTVTLPAADEELANNEVAVLGTVTGTVNYL
jgi:hypothetical protein